WVSAYQRRTSPGSHRHSRSCTGTAQAAGAIHSPSNIASFFTDPPVAGGPRPDGVNLWRAPPIGARRKQTAEAAMARVLVPLAEGFEEIETSVVVDVLRRAGIEVVLAGIAGPGPVRGSR